MRIIQKKDWGISVNTFKTLLLFYLLTF
ncbi:hypothetical protein Gotur_008071 [Gossypium turneri]